MLPVLRPRHKQKVTQGRQTNNLPSLFLYGDFEQVYTFIGTLQGANSATILFKISSKNKKKTLK